MMIIFYTYVVIGFLLAVWRLSNAKEDENSSLLCIGGVGIIFLWPLYTIYKIFKK